MLCDLAEHYHIYNYKAHPMEYIATLCCGFPANSRTIKKISNNNYTTEELLLANMVDRLSLIWWSKTKDGSKNRNRPQMISQVLVKKQSNVNSFDSVEEFEAMRRKIIEGKKNG